MNRITSRDILAIVVFIILILGGSAAGFIRHWRRRGTQGIARDTIESSIERSTKPATP